MHCKRCAKIFRKKKDSNQGQGDGNRITSNYTTIALLNMKKKNLFALNT